MVPQDHKVFQVQQVQFQVLQVPDGPKGEDGQDGTSVRIIGATGDQSGLPGGGGSAEIGDGIITEDDGHLHVWDGAQWEDVGEIRGPEGPTGPTGPDRSRRSIRPIRSRWRRR